MAVPALWEMHIVALHPLVTGHEIDVAPVESVSNMKISTRVGRGGVNAVGGFAAVDTVELV